MIRFIEGIEPRIKMMGTALDVTRDEHTAQELRRLALDMNDPGQVRRVQAIAFVMEGASRTRVAEIACVDRKTVRGWVVCYNDYGVDGLATRTSPGRPRLMTPSQAEELLDVVLNGPDLDKDGVARWRCADLVKQAIDRLGIRKVHPSTMGKWLHRMRLKKLTARPHHPKRDVKAQQEFKDNFKEKVEKALPAKVKEKKLKLEIWFQDEARVGQQGMLSRIWALVGSRPEMVRDNRRTSAYIYGAICPARRVGAALIMAAANTESMNAHLAEISSQVSPKAHAVLVCDGAGWHEASKEILVPGNMTLLTLPAYSPELNPMETVWEYLRDNRFGSRVWKSYTEVVRACASAWNWFVSDAPRIASIGTREWAVV
jgi:transposase